MNEENETVDGDLLVDGNLEYFGMVSGTTTVAQGGSLVLRGMCRGDLVVSAGGAATVHGVVLGNIVNAGVVELHGTVRGNVRSRGGRFSVSPEGSVVGVIDRCIFTLFERTQSWFDRLYKGASLESYTRETE